MNECKRQAQICAELARSIEQLDVTTPSRDVVTRTVLEPSNNMTERTSKTGVVPSLMRMSIVIVPDFGYGVALPAAGRTRLATEVVL